MEDKGKTMKLVVGLGNPGNEYEDTRHNAGFRVMDLLGAEYGADFRKKSSFFGASYDYAKVREGNLEIILMKPLTYMNLSGSAVKGGLDWFKIKKNDLLLVHDDVSLPLGKIRVQRGGGAGGQHGVESVIEHLKGDKNFNRIKVGVGPDPGGHIRAQYVLQSVPEKDVELYKKVLELTANCIKFILKHGVERAANKYNGIDLANPKPPKQSRKNELQKPLDNDKPSEKGKPASPGGENESTSN